MKKFFFLLILIIAAVLGTAWFYKAQILSDFLSRSTGLNIQMERLYLSFGGFRAEGVKIHEPNAETTLTLSSLKVDAKLTQLLNDVIIVDKIQMNDVNLESHIGKIKTGSVEKIYGFAKKLFEKKKESPSKGSKQKKFVLKSIEAVNVHISVDNPFNGNEPIVLNVPKLKIDNLDQNRELTLKQAIDQFVKRLLQAKN